MAQTPSAEELRARAREQGIDFDAELPVASQWVEIAQAMHNNPVLILCGETGSGKTTQLPKIALALGRAARGKTIAHTQPRRLAATSVARRIAAELKSPLGDDPSARVGYSIRFQDRSRPGIPIRLMTDGILLAETQNDPLLRRYDTIIIDEAHERSLNIDFLLGILHRILPQRPELRLVITSATLNAQRFAEHFGQGGQPAPVLEVSGRLFPVEIRWRPPANPEADLIDRVVAVAEEALGERLPAGMPGDLLVFLPGEREIRAAADALNDLSRRRGAGRALEVIPLFSRLSQADQERIFRPSGSARRIVLSTNLAETSLTVPGIGIVIDSGLARVKRYRVRGKVEQLQIEPIAQAQANQRSGRAGRLAAGICYRLYDESDFIARPAFADPEVHRSSLASVILQMKALGLEEVDAFPFVDPPSRRAITDGLAQLKELGALDAQQRLTPVGRQLSALPLDPKLARMVVEAARRGALREVLVIVAALSIQDPRDRPLQQQGAADAAHRRFADPRSEFVSWVRLWDWTEEVLQGSGPEHKPSRRQVDQTLRAAFLSPLRVREWRDVHRQIHDWALAQGWKENEQPADYQSLHCALLAGLLSNIGMRIEEATRGRDGGKDAGPAARPGGGRPITLWQGAHDIKFAIWPGSMLAKKPPKWLMAAEQVETSRLFARTIAAIEPEWLEDVGRHLIKVSVGNAHWEKKAGRAVGHSRGTLHGLTVYAQRRVAWSRQGPAQAAEARMMLIRHGLIEGDMECKLPFFQKNQRLLDEVHRMEQKARRHDLLVDTTLLEAFYDQQLPESVVDQDSLEAWVRKVSETTPDVLVLRKEDLLRHEASGITTEQFPKSWTQGGLRLALDYVFKPGESDDGMTVTVPVSALHQVDPQALDWLVPGMRKEKVLQLLRSLPQRHRRHLLPLADYAEAFCARWDAAGDGSARPGLLRALVEDIAAEKGLALGLEDFKREDPPPFLSPRYRVVDPHGRVLGQSRDLGDLQARLAPKAQEAFAPEPLSEAPTKAWTFGEWKASMPLRRAGQTLEAFVAIEDLGEAEGVRLRLLDRADKARAMTELGLMRLLTYALKEPLRSLERDLTRDRDIALAWAGLGLPDRLWQQFQRRLLRRAFLQGDWPTDAKSFEACLANGRSRMLLLGQEMLRWLRGVLVEASGVSRRLHELKLAPGAARDMREQLSRLLAPNFLEDLADERSRHLPRYLKAMAVRIDKLRQDPARDNLRMDEVLLVERPFLKWVQGLQGSWNDDVQGFRWQLEELRVHIFAQELRTPAPVSVKRLQKSFQMLQSQRVGQ